MDLLEATEFEIKRHVGGRECTFRFLTANDRAELLRTDLKERQDAWRAERAELIENLKLAGIEGGQMFAELETFRERRPYRATESDWLVFINDPTKEVALFTASLRPVHGDEAETLAKQSRLSMEDKAKICGVAVKQPEESDDAPDDKLDDAETPDPNERIPASYGTTGPT